VIINLANQTRAGTREIQMKVFLTFSGVVRLAGWLFVLGIAFGLAFGLFGLGGSHP
jgi:hypothetical protein